MKIVELADLQKRITELKASGKIIVHCHGVFDLLHIGHIRYLREARKFGDVLVVTVTPDRYVDKGPYRPAFSEAYRAESIASLDCVDFVAINKWPTAEETLRTLRPDLYVKGAEFRELSSDMTGKIGKEAEVVREIGARLVFTADVVFSSSNLINRYLSVYPEEVRQYLDIFRNRYGLEDALAAIDGMSAIRALVIGDTILDEYQYCTALGISSKDPVLALQYQSRDIFAGGVLAIANHVGNFADSVRLVSVLGELDRSEDFIRSKLVSNVDPYFATQHQAPTIRKQRFLDGYSFNKLFEVYMMNDSGLSEDEDRRLCSLMAKELPNYDLVIAADFGHGAISERMVRVLEEGSRFLAVNTQANAGNRGFHSIDKFSRADFVCLAAHEIHLIARSRSANDRMLAEQVGNRMGCRKLVVTRGRHGCLVWEPGNVVQVPAFAQDAVDRIGAGDTFFSVASLAACMNVPSEILGLLGNVAGAEAVRIIGNQKPIEKMSIKKHLTAMLK